MKVPSTAVGSPPPIHELGQSAWICALVMLLAACPSHPHRPRDGTDMATEKAQHKTPATDPKAGEDAVDARQESAHQVVFADRTSQGYLLLLKGNRPEPPTRDQLVKMVERTFPGNLEDEEVRLLISLIRTEPHRTDFLPEGPSVDPVDPADGADAAVSARERARRADLLGLHIEVLGVGAGEGSLIPEVAFDDPVLLRELDPQARLSLRSRRWALLLRADYRNQHAVRGLRLLQTLVRIVAKEKKALIFDPDTLETFDEAAFSRRRLQTSFGNVADQVAIVPFPDTRNGQGRIRLSSRGMRRFGAVDIELDGLPPDPNELQRATNLMYALALSMIRSGEVDASGLAVQLDPVVAITFVDAQQAYASSDHELFRCSDCPAQTLVHLVERPPQPQDPSGHVVARIVAPRAISDAADYDHPAWVREALDQIFGPDPGAPRPPAPAPTAPPPTAP
jgi:hypothetical protein